MTVSERKGHFCRETCWSVINIIRYRIGAVQQWQCGDVALYQMTLDTDTFLLRVPKRFHKHNRCAMASSSFLHHP